MVDFLGCAYVDIDQRYFNDVSGPGGYATIDIEPGYQKLCGQDALDYVRYRHTDNDLVRGARQQDFIRQLLRQKGVRKRLNFSKRKELARITGRYTSTDKSLRETSQIFSLLKLGLAVASKPIQEVPFGDGRIEDEGHGQFLVASEDALHDTVDDFLNARPLESARVKLEANEQEKEFARKTRKKKRNKSSSRGRAWRSPRARARTRRSPPPARSTSRSTSPSCASPAAATSAPSRARTRSRTSSASATTPTGWSSASGVAGEYYGIQGMEWKRPPILDGPHDTTHRRRPQARHLLRRQAGATCRLADKARRVLRPQHAGPHR